MLETNGIASAPFLEWSRKSVARRFQELRLALGQNETLGEPRIANREREADSAGIAGSSFIACLQGARE